MAKLHAVLLLLPLVLSECPANIILAISDNAKFVNSENNLQDSFMVMRNPAWVGMEGANWVWVSTIGAPSEANGWTWVDSEAVFGTYTFIGTFTLAEWKRPYLSSLTLSIAADERYSVTLNGEVIEPGSANYHWDSVGQYELKDKFLGSNQQGDGIVNTLEVVVSDDAGPGGVVYKVEATFN